jgi:multiple sugar transport system ATP-binding protein
MGSIRFENIEKNIQDHSILSKLNFKIENGEFACILGPSGCGKTTILRIIAGLDEATDGNVFINEKCVNNVEPKNRNVAMVFQDYALYPHLSVYDNISVMKYFITMAFIACKKKRKN